MQLITQIFHEYKDHLISMISSELFFGVSGRQFFSEMSQILSVDLLICVFSKELASSETGSRRVRL